MKDTTPDTWSVAKNWSQAYHLARHHAATNPLRTETDWQYFRVGGEFAWITASGAFRPMNESENDCLAEVYEELDREEQQIASQVEHLQIELNKERKLRKRLQSQILDLVQVAQITITKEEPNE